MLPGDDNTRDLLPPIATSPDDILGPEMPFVGSVVLTGEGPLPPHQPALHAAASLPHDEQGHAMHDDDSGGSSTNMSPKDATSSSAGSYYSARLVLDGEGNHFVPVSAHHASLSKSSASSDGHGTGRPQNAEGGSAQPGSDGDGIPIGQDPGDASGGLAESDDAHSISVSQIAIVDQEASIIVNGYLGKVVASLRIDQDLLMDQDVDIDFIIDGDGHFNIVLDQSVRIDQSIQIDIEIFDVDGVLYVNMYLHDAIEIEQSTIVDMLIGDGSLGGTIEVDQTIEMSQNVDIDIDIEDELEELYTITIQVETLQQADVDQNAAVDVTMENGEIDIDVDATQTAFIEQQTIIHADFALI